MNHRNLTGALGAASLIAGGAAAWMIAGAAQAQVDPFAAAAPAPKAAPSAMPAATGAPPPAPKPGSRSGFLGVSSAVGASYVNSQTSGHVTTDEIKSLPTSGIAPFPFQPRVNNAKSLVNKTRIFIPSYSLAIIRSGGVRASGMGQGSEIAQRATSITTVMAGVPDELAIRLADEAYDDLVKQLTAAGLKVVTPQERDANPGMAKLKTLDQGVKGENDWTIYAAHAAPTRLGGPLAGSALATASESITLSQVSADLDALVLQPYLALDYEQIGGSGSHAYSSSASAGAEVKFVARRLGAAFYYGNPKGQSSGFGGGIDGGGYASDELFGVMFQVDNRSDDTGMQRALALAGLSNMYRQSLYYGVEVVPERYAALARAAYQGLNAVIVREVKQARGLAAPNR